MAFIIDALDDVKDMMGTLTIGAVLGGTGALYLLAGVDDFNSLAILAGASTVPYVLSSESNLLAGTLFQIVGVAVPYVAMSMLGLLSVGNVIAFTLGGTMGGVLAISLLPMIM